MPLRQYGYCRLLPLGRLLARGRREIPSHARCIAGSGKARAGSETRPSPHHQTHNLISHVGIADRSHDRAAGSRPTASHKGQAKSQALSRLRDLEFASSIDTRIGLGTVPILERRDNRDPDIIAEPIPRDSSAQLERDKSKFAQLERHKEDQLLLNRLLRDKGYLSHDWRIPHRLLEQYGTTQIFQGASQDRNLFRKVIHTNDATSEQDLLPRIRTIRTLDKDALRPAREIPRPDYWSESTVANYVQDLVQYQYYQNQVPDLSQPKTRGSSNTADIITAYNEVFHTTVPRDFLSVAAYNIAFRFYYDHGLFSKARDLFFDMEDSRMEIPRETFRILLRGAANSQDLHNFTFMLQRAIERGFKPDLETWNILIMAMPDYRVRAVIIQSLKDRLIFNTSPMKRGSRRIIIQHEVASRIERHGDRGDFLHYMDDQYGPEWVTTSTVNKLLYEFSKRKSIHETLGLLPGLKQRGFLPNEISLDTLLQHCRRLRQPKSAVETVEAFRYHFSLQPRKLACETLFRHAWRSRLLNFTRVIWRYACVYGFVTSRMRRLVFRSLLANAPAPASKLRDMIRAKILVRSRAKKFKELVGRFVVGVGKPQEAKQAELAELAELERTFNKRMFKTLKSGRRRKQQKAELAELELNLNHLTLKTLEFGRRRWAGKWALIHLESDLRVAGYLHIQQGLGNLLLQAFNLDMLWASQRKLRDATLQHVLSVGFHLKPEWARRSRKLEPELLGQVEVVRIHRPYEPNLLRRVEVLRIRRPHALSRPRERQPDRASPVNQKCSLGPVLRKNVHYIRRNFRTVSILPRPPVVPLLGKKYSVSIPIRKVLLCLVRRLHAMSPTGKQSSIRFTLQKTFARKSSISDGVRVSLISPRAQEVSDIWKRPTKPSVPAHSGIQKLAGRKSLIGPVARKPWVKVISRNHPRAVDFKPSVNSALLIHTEVRKLVLGTSAFRPVVSEPSVRSNLRMFSISIVRPSSQKPLARPQRHLVRRVMENQSVDHLDHPRRIPSTNILKHLSGSEVPESSSVQPTNQSPFIIRKGLGKPRMRLRKFPFGLQLPNRKETGNTDPPRPQVKRSPIVIRKDLGKPRMSLRKLLFVPRLPIRKEPGDSDVTHTREHSVGPLIQKYTVKETSAAREMASLHRSLDEIVELDEALNKKL